VLQNESISIVKSNSYRLADDVWGIGFKTADKIARQLGFEKESYERCRLGLLYVLSEFSNQGHCYATRVQLIHEAAKILELQDPLLTETLEKMIKERSVILEGEDIIYLSLFYYSETGTHNLNLLLQESLNPTNVTIIIYFDQAFQVKRQPLCRG